MQFPHALQSIGGLLVRGLCHGQGILSLGFVHLGQQLALAHMAALAHMHLPDHAHAGETDCH